MSTYSLSQREIPHDDSWDVVVVGGGPAGCAAAIAAGRAGSKTLLVEGTGALGGMGTSGLIPAWCPFSDHEKIIYKGIAEEIFQASKAGRAEVKQEAMNWVAIRPEQLKQVYDDKVTGAGVSVLFHTLMAAVDVDGTGTVGAIIMSNKSGLTAVSAKVYIDGTGDADLAVWAGSPYEQGDDKGTLMPATHCFAIGNVDTDAYVANSAAVNEFGKTLVDNDKYDLIRSAHFCSGNVGPGTIGFNAGHMWEVDNTDSAGTSAAMFEGRRIAAQYRDALAEKFSEMFGASYLVTTADLMGIRETRRIVGDYVLTTDDYIAQKTFDDEIGRNSYPIDIHFTQEEAAAEDKINVMERFKPYGVGESHGIPYRCLIPRNVKNVLVAGRSISTDRNVQGSTRVMPVCLVMGEAAGTAAAMAAAADGDVRAVDVDALRETLRQNGGYLR